MTSPTALADGATLRERRRALALTQLELANGAQLSVRTVQGIESGEFPNPRPSTLRQLHAALTERESRATQRTGAVRPYAGDVPATDQNGVQTPADVSTGVLPDRYARPARVLSTAPSRGSHPLFWLELGRPAVVVTSSGTVTESRVTLCRAVPVSTGWRTTVLATDVVPLDGVELVDALRAFRSDPRDRPRR